MQLSIANSPTQIFGKEWETKVGHMLEEGGLPVDSAPSFFAPYDLASAYGLIEVKVARPTWHNARHYWRWKFECKRIPAEIWLVVLVALTTSGPVMFLIPRAELNANYIDIPSDPATYTGRLAKYRVEEKCLITCIKCPQAPACGMT
jgi:hypothetical protein